ncbi:MAG TPA: hypothetical protein DCG30_02320 [Ruminococcus sp.]|nr:hypothetical protein [Ruminococcus sp.]
MITAVYGFRNKREYIFRTNEMREVKGASFLLSEIYSMLISESEKYCIRIKNSWRDDSEYGVDFDISLFEKSGYDAEVLYSDGDELCIIFRNYEIYLKANRIFSRFILNNTYSADIFSVCTEFTGSFREDMRKLSALAENAGNQENNFMPCNVLPFTLADKYTFMPVYENKLTAEAYHKLNAYERNFDRNRLMSDDSRMLAIICIGSDNRDILSIYQNDDYNKSVSDMRRLVCKHDSEINDFTLYAVENCMKIKNIYDDIHGYIRITGKKTFFICLAEDAFEILNDYLLEAQGDVCVGTALFNRNVPLSYACERAEKFCSPATIGFFCFSSGKSTGAVSIRYSNDEFEEFLSAGKVFEKIGKKNLEILSQSIIMGDSYFTFETERIKSEYRGGVAQFIRRYSDNTDKLKELVSNVSVFYDVLPSAEDNRYV